MDVLPKPRLRGVFHQYAFYVALVAGVVLVAVSESGRERVATWIYAVALAAMFGVSALYPRVDWKSNRVRTWMRRLDHSTILLLIAGTYTPFALLAFDGAVADAILNHKQSATRGGVLGVYQRASRWPEQVNAVKLWARMLTDAIEGPGQETNVVAQTTRAG